MSYVTGREWVDALDRRFREHRPGWYRYVNAPIIDATEHPVAPFMTSMLVDAGTFIIEEEP